MKTTKRALFSSVIALILCFSMLVGTTFAWFTDSVESGVNHIIAGNLDVELYHKGNQVTNTYDKLFKGIKWEPGVVAYENITVANEGTLALKYQLGINFDNATPAKNGKTLADALQVAIVENGVSDYTNDAAGRAKLISNCTFAPMASVMQAGKLEAKSDDVTVEDTRTYGIVIWWEPTDEDNDFNMNNEDKAELSINLGIKLFATQVEGEFDSFGPDYDEDAWHEKFQVASADDLNDALANAKPGDVITVMEDIEAGDTITIPAAPATFAMRSAPAPVVLDLNGKTIKGTVGRDAEGNRVHVLVNNGNLVLTNGTVESAGKNGGSAIYNAAGATLVLENVTVLGAPKDGSSWPSYGINNYGYMVVEDATVKTYHGGIATADGAETIINYANVDVGQGTATAITSYTLYTYGTAKLTVNGGIFANTASDAKGTGGAIVCQSGDNAIIITGGSFSGGCGLYGDFVISGGTFDRDVKNLVAEGYKSVDNGDGTFTVLFPQESFDSLIKNAGENATIEIPAGTYTFPASDIKAGQTLICAPGTVFEGTSKLNINGATVIGATFSNPNGTAADQTINGTFKNCVFEGKNGLRWCYAGDTVVFEDCVFSGSTYGVHFDGGANKVVFRRCTISGFNAMGGAVEMATFEDCTFKSNGKSGYNGINMWGSTEMIGCTFVFDGTAGTEWVDACGDNKTYTFTNCIVTDGKTEKGIETVVGNYGVGNTIIINGETLGLVSDEVVLDADLAAGKDVVMTSDMKFNASQTTANSGYGATGVSVKGGVLDGNGHSLGINNWGTWDAAVHTTGGTIKNLTINSGMRGIFMGSATADVYIDNVIINGTIYTFNSDGGDKNYGVYISNSTLNGWTSHSDVHKEVVYTKCSFGEGQGYAFCRPYGPTKFVGCNFSEGFTVDPVGAVTFENCTINGVALTDANLATLVTNPANATVK